MTTRILILSNFCLLVGLVFALKQPTEAPPTPQSEASPRKRLEKETTHESETTILSALPKANAGAGAGARRNPHSSRLDQIAQLLKDIEHKDRSALIRMQSELMAKDRSGFYDTGIERQLIDYRIGELGGEDPTRWMFPDGDGGVYSRALILEGWAHTHPAEALAWWAKLGDGKRRDSLVPPLVQGYLSAAGTSWRTLLSLLGPEEFSGAAIPLLVSAIREEEPAELIESFEEEFLEASYTKRQRLAAAVNDHLCQNGSYEDLQTWYSAWDREETFWVLNAERHQQLVRAIAAKGGERAFDFLPENQRMRAARSWVQAESFAAGKWLKASARDEAADQVAFFLAIESVTANPDQSREWAEFISDEQLAETIDGIISGYEK